MKTRLITLFMLAVMGLCGQNTPEEWSGPVKRDSDALSAAGRQFLTAKKFLATEKGKHYRLSGEFKTADGTVPNQVLFGIMCFDQNRKVIADLHVNAIKNTDTVLAEDAPVGSQKIKIKNGSNWKKGRFIQFNSLPDRSDLPNRNILPGTCRRIFQRDGYAEVTLSEPIKSALSAGTGLRQTVQGGYLYAGGIFRSSTQWKKHAGVIKEFWPGTAFVKIIILANYDGSVSGESILLFKNIQLTPQL